MSARRSQLGTRGVPLLGFALTLLCWLSVACAETRTEAKGIDPAGAKQWLQRMLAASQAHSYEGTFVYLQGSAQDVEVMRIAHSSATGQQRMAAINGVEREVIVANQAVMCLLPRQQIAFSPASESRSPFPISMPHALDRLEESYQFELLGEDRVANRATRVLGIQPRDELRYGYRLWLDRDTALVLRSALVDTGGRFIEQLIFTAFEIKPEIDAASLRPRLVTQNATPLPTAAEVRPVKGSIWQISMLPSGFERVSHRQYVATDGHSATEHMVFSDGLATVSVFLEPMTDDTQVLLEGASMMDAMNAFGRVIGQHQVIVVGEVPAATVAQIAGAIRQGSEFVAN